jgi:hypothetical protein
MSIYKDTVPYYISTEVLDMAEDCVETLEEYTKYSERGRLWEEEKTKAMFEHMFARIELENVKDSLLNKESVNREYLACVNYSGTNAMGGIVSSRSIFIMDKEEPSKILGIALYIRGVTEIFRAYYYKTSETNKYPVWWLVVSIMFITFGSYFIFKGGITKETLLWVLAVAVFVFGIILLSYGIAVKPEKKIKKSK